MPLVATLADVTPLEIEMSRTLTDAAYLRRYFKTLLWLVLLGLLAVLPYTWWWLRQSGDVAVERAVAAQAKGDFALFGSGVSQDFVDYKLRLYAAVKPAITVVGSSRVMQFRATCFRKPFLNMGGVAGNLAVLRSTIEAMLRIHKPEAVILGLDFWWFLPQWEARPFEEVPPTSGSYNYGFATLKKPWTWLLEGKISPVGLCRALFAGISRRLSGRTLRDHGPADRRRFRTGRLLVLYCGNHRSAAPL